MAGAAGLCATAAGFALVECVCDATAEAEIQVMKHTMESSPAKTLMYDFLFMQKRAFL